MIQNYDHCLRFQVIDKRISFIDDSAAEIVADNHGNICIHIEFDEQWDGVGKVARFIFNGKWTDVVLDADGDCYCPSEVVKKGRFSLGVYGAELKTTTPIVVTVLPSILSDSGEELPKDPTPGIYEQILDQYAVTVEAADNATQAAWNAVNEVAAAVDALNRAKRELEEGGFITSLKEHNRGYNFKIWLGTEEEYEEIKDTIGDNVLCLTTDGTSKADLIEEMASRDSAVIDSFNDSINDEVKAYGLGYAITKPWSEVDSLVSPGWYKFNNDVSFPGVSSTYAYMLVSAYSAPTIRHATQTIYLVDGSKRHTLTRHLLNGVWEAEWAWESPPLVADNEYKTTERWNNKAVYTKRTEFKSKSHYEWSPGGGEESINIIRHNAYTSWSSLPVIGYDEGDSLAVLKSADVNHYFGTIEYDDISSITGPTDAETVYLQVWYTKN